MRYKVQFFQDNIYQVFEMQFDIYSQDQTTVYSASNLWSASPIFQGTLPECEAYINLKEKGYM
jgi:hypothetical protein